MKILRIKVLIPWILFQASEPFFAGIKVTSSSRVRVEEGGPPAHLTLESSIPVLCSPQDRAFGECCIHLEVAMNELEEPATCPTGSQLDRVGHL